MRFSRSLLLIPLLLATSALLFARPTGAIGAAQVMQAGTPLARHVPWTLTRHITVVQTLAMKPTSHGPLRSKRVAT